MLPVPAQFKENQQRGCTQRDVGSERLLKCVCVAHVIIIVQPLAAGSAVTLKLFFKPKNGRRDEKERRKEHDDGKKGRGQSYGHAPSLSNNALS